MYCALCARPVDARRHVGVGTVALAVLTGGMWLIAIPFYPKRCSICHSSAVSATSAPVLGAGVATTATALLEQRLGTAEGELESAQAELERVRTERDFYRQLLGDPTLRKSDRRPPQ